MTEYWCVRGTTQTKTFRNSPVNATKTKMHTSYHFPFLHSSIQHSFLIFTNKTRSFTGLDTFKGEIIHSHDYKTLTGYEDKRIVVIGIGNSGGDAAVELSRVAKQVVHLNPRHWLCERIFVFCLFNRKKNGTGLAFTHMKDEGYMSVHLSKENNSTCDINCIYVGVPEYSERVLDLE